MQLTLRQRASWSAHLFKAVTQQHHRGLTKLFAPYVPADAIVLDIGAHAGQFSKLFARMAPRGRVYAFEPSAYARSIMEPALRLNRIGNVILTPVGLSDRAGQMTLHTPLKPSTSLGYGGAHLGDSPVSGAQVDQTVTLTTLDAFIADERLLRLDLIKADIEGWEMRALMGGAQALARFHPALYLEVDPVWMARAGDTPEGLFDWLSALGYQAFATPDLAPVDGFAVAGDYLFVPRERP